MQDLKTQIEELIQERNQIYDWLNNNVSKRGTPRFVLKEQELKEIEKEINDLQNKKEPEPKDERQKMRDLQKKQQLDILQQEINRMKGKIDDMSLHDNKRIKEEQKIRDKEQYIANQKVNPTYYDNEDFVELVKNYMQQYDEKDDAGDEFEIDKAFEKFLDDNAGAIIRLTFNVRKHDTNDAWEEKIVYYTLAEYIVNLMKIGKFDFTQFAKEGSIGSDQAFNLDQDIELIGVNILDEFYRAPDQFNKKIEKSYKFLEGEYFNYLNKNSSVDLRKYQIGWDLESHKELNKEHCFIYALQQSKNFTDYEINEIKLQLVDEQTKFSARMIKNLKNVGTIYLYTPKKNGTTNQRAIKTIGQCDKETHIGLFMNHYFIYEQNREICDELNIIPLKTIGILMHMYENNMFQEITQNIGVNANMVRDIKISAPNGECDSMPTTNSDDVKDITNVVCADYEAFTKDDDFKNVSHIPYILCFRDKNGMNTVKNVQQMIKKLATDDQKVILVYFHNLAYDSSFILQSDYTIDGPININGKLSQFTVYTKSPNKKVIKFIFRDSVLLFQCPLNKLPKMFYLKQYKEIFPYNYYNKVNYANGFGNIDEAMKSLKCVKQDFINSLKQADSLLADEQKFDMVKYAKYYCQIDVNILYESVWKFRQWILEAFELDIYHFISISSLSLQYQKRQGCFDGVVSLAGQHQKFIQQCVVGGRCMIANNQKVQIKQRLSDLDGNSLYPSAQNRAYYPTGKPHFMDQPMIKYYNNKKNLFNIKEDKDSTDKRTLYLEVKLSELPKKQRRFPLRHEKTNGINNFVNKITQNQYMTHVELQDVVIHQGYDYEIISGLCFYGRNYKIQEVISNMYNLRVEFRLKQNPIQIVYKMILNVSYGKTIEKLHDVDSVIVKKEDWLQFVELHFNHVIQIIDMGNNFLIKLKKETATQYTYPHVGSLILAYSKRIMNEVFGLCEDNNIMIYYQDTDSCVIEQKGVNQIKKLYKDKYGKDLIGDNELGKFGNDFESKKGKVLFSKNLIALGKKCYIHELIVRKPVQSEFAFDIYEQKVNGVDKQIINEQFEDEEETNKYLAYSDEQIDECVKTGELFVEQHIRMKGIPEKSIQSTCKKYGISSVQLYEQMFDGKEFDFDMVDGKDVVMKKQNWASYINLDHGDRGTVRKIKFQ